jgi:N-succinyldiaminopimelate aminotransferase
VAVYFSSPGNPTGEVFSEAALATIADFARANDLWILSDEVYEDYAYEGRHASIGALAPERTLTAFSFSKAFGMTGHRVGYLVGPASAMDDARRVVTHIWYSVTTASQELALRALGGGGDRWLADTRASYVETGRKAAAILGVAPPQGGTFLFVDAAAALDERGLDGLLEDCLDENLLVAPGPSFGHDYGTFVRLCFTAARPDVVLRGAEKLARRLGR